MDLKQNVGIPESETLFVHAANMIFPGETRIKSALNALVIAIVMKLTGIQHFGQKRL